MAETEQMMVSLTADMAAAVNGAVQDGEFASSSEVVREALRDWKMKRALQRQELSELKADIDAGMADVAAGRAREFDAERIAERGRTLLSSAAPCT